MAEIRQLIGLESGQQEHLNRRMRELYRVFEIERTRRGTETLYRLIKRREQKLNTDGISMKVRALILKDQRCAQCGRTPLEDQVKLHVDHKIPQEWGGTNDLENLQPLCADCNEGKRNFYATYDKYADKIKEAANYDEPHRRIGELLKAFDGEFVRPDLIEIVANSKQYQDDWQKRLRELRILDWVIDVDKRKEGKRFVAYYAVRHYEPWPEGNIRTEITRREVLRKVQK
jgi:5-methylcytosine-specific restriction endonuclease McrA